MRASERARKRERERQNTYQERGGGSPIFANYSFFFLIFPLLLSLNDTLKREDHIIDTAGAKLKEGGGEEKIQEAETPRGVLLEEKNGSERFLLFIIINHHSFTTLTFRALIDSWSGKKP